MTHRFTFGLIGERIGYSRSPAVFNAIFAVDGVNGSFQLFDIPADNFGDEFPRVVKSGVQGLAVTIPHKERVLAYMDDLDEVSRSLSAVNSIAVGTSLRGFNTDVAGFGLPLIDFHDELEAGTALVLGAGGAARAVLYALARDFGCRRFVIAARNREAAERARRQVMAVAVGIEVGVIAPEDLARSDRESWTIVVNATPLGGPNFPDNSPLPNVFDWRTVSLYYDLNYNFDNGIVEAAAVTGVPALDGSAMLVGQALESYRLWTGRTVEFEAVYEAAFPDWRPPAQANGK